MSAQLIELIIFAGIAFIIIGKLINNLGITSEDEPKNSKSFFGEPSRVKDVTYTIKTRENTKENDNERKARQNIINIHELVVPGVEEEVRESLAELTTKMPSFDLAKFLKGAKTAFKIIIDPDTSPELFIELVDKRYIDQLRPYIVNSAFTRYKEVNAKNKNNSSDHSLEIKAKVSEIYIFGNNVFIKVVFTSNNTSLHEEWSFTRNIPSSLSNWYLTNIDYL